MLWRAAADGRSGINQMAARPALSEVAKCEKNARKPIFVFCMVKW